MKERKRRSERRERGIMKERPENGSLQKERIKVVRKFNQRHQQFERKSNLKERLLNQQR